MTPRECSAEWSDYRGYYMSRYGRPCVCPPITGDDVLDAVDALAERIPA